MPKQKDKKELERRYASAAAGLVNYQDHIDFRFYDDFNDDAFAYLMRNVRGVNMLDLNGTDITDESIKLLKNLEYVYEIRAKDCCGLTDNCADDLNQLTSVTFLHLKNTAITVDGLLKLNNLHHLKTLMFSAEDIPAIWQKLVQLKAKHLTSEIVLNSKPQYFNAAELFIEGVKNQNLLFRFKLKNISVGADWSAWIKHLHPNLLEAENQGAHQIDTIEWVEIKPMENNMNLEKHTKENLDSAFDFVGFFKNLEYPFMENDGVYSVYVLDHEI